MDDKREVQRLQSWIVDNYNQWLRVLGLGERLTEEEFLWLGREFKDKGLHCANLAMITVYWDIAEPIARENIKWLLWAAREKRKKDNQQKGKEEKYTPGREEEQNK